MPSGAALPITERFVLQELAGAGGMGTVYRAIDTRTNQTVAVKLLQASDNPQATERFAREAQLLHELRHPGIVEYLAHGATGDGQPYLAMEWLTGEDLARRVARGPLSLADSLTLLRRTASALAVAHQRGIVHRDLKPSNLFLRGGEVERIALLDFGIARRREFSHTLTATGGVIGTPAYMAPEQARGERDLTPAVDVFSLGCVLFECLTGSRPFIAERAVAVLAMIIFSEPPRLRAVRPDLPRAVEALLARMLAKNPGERLPDATALLAALDALDEALSRPLATTLEVSVSIATLQASAPIERVADTEQHLVSVLVATSRRRSGELTASDAAPVLQLAEIQGLARALEVYGARVELLADGSLVATLVDARGAATDQAAQAARCALSIRARWPEAAIALCTGRGRLRERLPIGEVLDRAMLLLLDLLRGGRDRAILEDRRDSRFPGERELRFRHVLMRDAAYGLLTADNRADSHRAAAQYLEARGEPDPLVLAEQFHQGGEATRAIPYYVQAAEQSYETNDMAAVLACADRGLRCGAQGAQRGALLSLAVAVYLGREQYAEVLAAGTEAIELLPEGSKHWCRAFQNLFPAATLTQQAAVLAELSSRFARIEPNADARGEYVRVASGVSTMFGLMGEKVAARAFLARARGICAKLDRGEIAWADLRVAESIDQYLLEEAPWACMLSTTEGKRLLSMAGEQRVYSIVCTYHGRALHELGDRAAAEAELRNNLADVERLNEPFRLVYAKTHLARLLAGSAPAAELDEPAQLAKDVIAAKNQSLPGVVHGVLAEILRRRGDLPGAETEARVACEAARPFPPLSWELIALRMQILIEQGRAAQALPIGDAAVRELERLGLAGSGELALRLAVAEAHHAVGDTAAAAAALAVALERLWIRVDDIPEGLPRERYLTKVPVNAQLIALGRAWLGEAAVTLPNPGLMDA